MPGFEFPKTLRLDGMHCEALGVMPRWEGTVAQRLMSAGVFGTGPKEEKTALMVAAIRKLQKDLLWARL